MDQYPVSTDYRTATVPPFQGGEGFGSVHLGLWAARSTRGYHRTGFQPSARRPSARYRVRSEGASETVRPVRRRRQLSGLKAPNVTAWAEASPTSGGPGAQVVDFLGGLKGRNKSAALFAAPNVPPLQGGEGFVSVHLGLRAWRFTPGFHRTGFQPSASAPRRWLRMLRIHVQPETGSSNGGVGQIQSGLGKTGEWGQANELCGGCQGVERGLC